MTTLIVDMAAQAVSDGDTGSTKESFEAALGTQSEAAKTYFGLGLLGESNPFTSSPLPDSEGNVSDRAVAFRTVGEVLGGLIDQLANADISGVGADNVLSGLAADMADGDLDGQANGTPVDSLLGIDITDLQTIMTQPVDDLLAIPVPGAPEGTTIANINTLMVSEAQAFTGVTPDVIPEAPELERMQPGRDSDGDGVPDAIDAFPDDSSQSADVDGDGVADRFDPCIAVGAGFTDTDNDGVCEDVGAVPLDIYLEDARGVAADNTSPDVSITDDSQTVTYFVGSPVNLAGVASDIDEKDGPLLTYEWSLNARPSGSAAELNDATVLTPFFTADVEGDYEVTFTAFDWLYEVGTDENDAVIFTRTEVASSSVPATLTYTVAPTPITPVPPTANITTPDLFVLPGSVVSLDASGSFDPNTPGVNDYLTYTWTLVPPSGSSVTLSSTTAIAPTFTALDAGNYTISLVANDGGLDSSIAEIIIEAREPNIAPVANPGGDEDIAYEVNGVDITLDGSLSSDANISTNNTIVSYTWTLVSWPCDSGTCTFAGGDAPPTALGVDSSGVLRSGSNPTQSFNITMEGNDEIGEYTVNLVVSDGALDSQPVAVSYDVTKSWITSSTLFGSAIVGLALMTIPARRRKKLS
jgi:hypothetical protein